jgi:hypothetical protein
MNISVVGKDFLARDVYRFAWKVNRWQLHAFSKETREHRNSKKWVTTAEWFPARVNWQGVQKLEKPTEIPPEVVGLVRLRARKADVEI